ncbi:MAG: 2-oxo-4-hydroxy-4-carboxy-5-ureidoimidazoline decarboxylase [Kaiparowitsia implicata GSE-PSE-MK54-09C]|jgi:2-oxo-4-hydroxy-4-carboxy-5-ureidoimidazoline decarboxylase|nr:2-oxo-4-hydroxy-4-carboxy-5-ureidoimidazoline decarboxylase [Kaiparowitsia implicata GSE-PSE-MK54-09C]
MPVSLDDLNQMTQDAFVDTLGDVFEHTPAIARHAWEQRPFASVAALHHTMVAIAQQQPAAAQLALIRAHPDLGSKTKMADASVQEQAGVGLDRLNPEDYDRFQQLNQAYTEKFGFPFIVAVKEHTKESILQSFEQRLHHSPEAEQQTALAEIAKIAGYRLRSLIADSDC